MRFSALFLAALIGTACGGATPSPGSDAASAGGPDAAPTGAVSEAGREAPRTAADDGPLYVQAGAPGEAGRNLTLDELSALEIPGHTAADVRFVQGMIPHHAQALDMVALMPGRTTNERLLRLGGRIEISQRDEIALMSRWLRDRGEAVPGEGETAHGVAGGEHRMHGELMPGMLTPEQMAQLAAAEGVEFDRLFLELMIGHHQGAITMVRELFSTPGAGQDSWANQFAGDVEADQEMEIRRMRQMLAELR